VWVFGLGWVFFPILKQKGFTGTRGGRETRGALKTFRGVGWGKGRGGNWGTWGQKHQGTEVPPKIVFSFKPKKGG